MKSEQLNASQILSSLDVGRDLSRPGDVVLDHFLSSECAIGHETGLGDGEPFCVGRFEVGAGALAGGEHDSDRSAVIVWPPGPGEVDAGACRDVSGEAVGDIATGVAREVWREFVGNWAV